MLQQVLLIRNTSKYHAQPLHRFVVNQTVQSSADARHGTHMYKHIHLHTRTYTCTHTHTHIRRSIWSLLVLSVPQAAITMWRTDLIYFYHSVILFTSLQWHSMMHALAI